MQNWNSRIYLIDQYKDSTGTLFCYNPKNKIYFTKVSGKFSPGMAECIISNGKKLIGKYGTIIAFHDWEEMDSYDTEARVKMTQWGTEDLNKIEMINIFTKSKLVKMGVTVAGIVLGGKVAAHNSKEEFINSASLY